MSEALLSGQQPSGASGFFAEFSGKTTTFEVDGTVTETRQDDSVLVTEFNANGTITETLTKDGVSKVKTITFNGDESISEVVL